MVQRCWLLGLLATVSCDQVDTLRVYTTHDQVCVREMLCSGVVYVIPVRGREGPKRWSMRGRRIEWHVLAKWYHCVTVMRLCIKEKIAPFSKKGNLKPKASTALKQQSEKGWLIRMYKLLSGNDAISNTFPIYKILATFSIFERKGKWLRWYHHQEQ